MTNKKIEIFENYLPETLLRECMIYSRDVYLDGSKHGFRTNYSWDASMVHDSFPVLIHDIREGEFYERIKNLVETTSGMRIDRYVMFYYWTRFSFSPWHNDGIHGGGMTIYLNEVWNPNWGGAFLYEENEEIRAIYPKLNRAVLQRGGVMHHVAPVTFNGNVRATMQIFLEEK